MTTELAPRTGLIGKPLSNGLDLPADSKGECGKIARTPRLGLHSCQGEHHATVRSLAMHEDATTPPVAPDGYTLPEPLDFGVLGKFYGHPKPTQETIERVRAEVFGDVSMTPRERGKVLDAARIPPRKSESGHRVYFAQALTGGRIKIGCSKNPRYRLSLVRAESRIDVRLLGTVPGGFDIEAEIHQLFATERIPAKHRNKGEWFEPSADLLAFIHEFAEFRQGDEYIYLGNKRSKRVGR